MDSGLDLGKNPLFLNNSFGLSIEAVQRLAKSIDAFLPTIKDAADAFRAFAISWSRAFPDQDVQPSIRYARAGYPYGKNRLGKKRWCREMKLTNPLQQSQSRIDSDS